MADKILVNDIYPVDYFDLPNIKTQDSPSELWWASRERYSVESGLSTTEYVEIDLGRRRQINYLSFDIMKKPIDVTIEYDSTSFDDKSHTWIPVTPLSERGPEHPGRAYDTSIAYDDRIDFEAVSPNAWRHAQFYFCDFKGDILTTRFIRIGFTRRNDTWPTDLTPAFQWSVDVTNLRVARYTLDYTDARGIMMEVDNYDLDFFVDTEDYDELRQSFVMPFGYTRGEQGLVGPRDPVVTPIYPRMMGFGVLVDIIPPSGVDGGDPGTGDLSPAYYLEDAAFDWEIWDYTTSSPVNVYNGTVTGASNHGRCWIDVFFEESIETTPNTKMQFRIRSKNKDMCKVFYTWEPNIVASSVDTDVYVMEVQGADIEVTRFDNTSSVYRIWADIGESGEDIIGNTYRHGTRIDEAENVLDASIETQWISQPNPSPSAVECLYFDVRRENTEGILEASILDSVRVDPLFEGPYMHVYYSNESYDGNAPSSVTDWESLLWTPILEDYVLEKNQRFELPRPIRASWICLEFTRLQPMPYKIPTYPQLPSVQYREHPEWVKKDFESFSVNSNKSLIGTVTSLGNQQIVEIDILGTFDATNEFLYKSNSITDIVATGNTSTIKANATSAIDSTTLAKIMYSTSQNATSTVSDVTYDTILGSVVADRFRNNTSQYISERIGGATRGDVTSVSSPGARDEESMSHLANEKLFFNVTCRHQYAINAARFGTKAYFVGINEIEFSRKDYTARHDDPVITDILADPSISDSPLVEYNNWDLDSPTTIPTASPVYVTYRIGDIEYYDDIVQFETGDELDFGPIQLTYGGSRAVAVEVFSGANRTGQQYIIGKDVDIIYDPVLKTNSIRRNSQHYRLIPAKIDNYQDTATVVGRGKISSTDSTFDFVDSGTVTTIGIPSGVEL